MTATTKTKATARKTAAGRKTKTKIRKPATTTFKLVWRDVNCRVRRTPNYLSKGWSHIEVIVVSPKKAPLPITDTGYRSHFLDWIERDAPTKAWAKAEFKWRKGVLFA